MGYAGGGSGVAGGPAPEAAAAGGRWSLMERLRKLWRGRTMTFGVPLLVSGAVRERVKAREVRRGGERRCADTLWTPWPRLSGNERVRFGGEAQLGA